MTADVLIAQLLAALPDFRPSDPDLRTVTCDQAVQFLADRSRTDDEESFRHQLGRVLSIFEAAAESADRETRELILVDFMEMLHLFGPRCREVAAMFGPRLQRLRAEWEADYGPSMGVLCPEEGSA